MLYLTPPPPFLSYMNEIIALNKNKKRERERERKVKIKISVQFSPIEENQNFN